MTDEQNKNRVGRPPLSESDTTERISLTIPRRLRAAFSLMDDPVNVSEAIRRLIERDVAERQHRSTPHVQHVPDAWWELLGLEPIIHDTPLARLLASSAVNTGQPTTFHAILPADDRYALEALLQRLRRLFAYQTDEEYATGDEPEADHLGMLTFGHDSDGYFIQAGNYTIHLP